MNLFLAFFGLFGAFASITLALATDDHGLRCRCRPDERCWPSQSAWKSLKETIDGNLVAVLPVAHVCHEPYYDAAACNASKARSAESSWRASQPGAVQYTNWEAWPEQNQSCYFESGKSMPCDQGRVSLFSAMVETTEHVQAAVRFAAHHDIRLAIKNSGHCFLGRSTAPESLQIATHKMKSIKFTNNFHPSGAPSCRMSSGPAVTIGAGVDLKELYTAAGKRNRTLVAGFAHTVGPSGGYILGGGHSPLGPWKGMASDNALEFTVVNAKGEVVVANDYKNQDLFWALRGGGGGTFGVVVNTTIRTFPDVPAILAAFEYHVPLNKKKAYWDMMRVLHAHLPAMSDAGGGGYYFVTPSTKGDDGSQIRSIAGAIVFANQTDEKSVHKVIDPLAEAMQIYAGVGPQSFSSVSSLPSAAQFILADIPGDDDVTGTIDLVGSRLISRDFLENDGKGPQKLSDAMRSIAESLGVGFTGHVVAGGAVATSKVDSALNPAWRETLTHIAFGVSWNATTPLEEQWEIRKALNSQGVEKLRALQPDTGAYLNEADAYEVDFQKSFWGDNYEKLFRIKQEQDPRGLFIVRRGVGSEHWDDDGLCKISH